MAIIKGGLHGIVSNPNWDVGMKFEGKIFLRASPVIPVSASASGIEKWPPSRMQMQTQAELPLILHYYF